MERRKQKGRGERMGGKGRGIPPFSEILNTAL